MDHASPMTPAWVRHASDDSVEEDDFDAVEVHDEYVDNEDGIAPEGMPEVQVQPGKSAALDSDATHQMPS